ncbi:hypothetical protein M426DRAFT_256644 [Hypoxylon sp. CI-4A]|nr:hypothetical protein M426DRAFT_256644 [Hypoxylon sp. CI-4A]
MPAQQVYGTLGPNAIRLLSIAPGFASETINCNLIIVEDRDDAPEYDAISYVWGTGLSDETIMCNGQRMVVTENLIKAMRYLRPLPNWDSVITWPKDHALHSSRNVWRGFASNRKEEREHVASQQHRFLWIDAICINQDDVTEKENQVKSMDRIYANATTVKIWLGETSDAYSARSAHLTVLEAQSGLAFMRSPSFHLGQYGTMPIVLAFIAQAMRNVRVGSDYSTASRSAVDTAYRNKVHGFPISTAEEWEILRDFFNNPWFERIWIVQEVVLAKRAIFILGDWQVEWEALGEAATWFQSNGFGLPSDVKFNGKMKDLLPISKVAAMWQMHSTPGKRRPLLQMLRDLRGRKATLKVDKVYAAYSLAEETVNTRQLGPLLEPTYDEALFHEVYPNVVRFLVIDHGNLAVLSHAGGIQGVRASDCPSWVPDWSQGKVSVELINDHQDNPPYDADGGEYLAVGDIADPKRFSVKGIKVPGGVIRAYGDKLISYGFRHTTYQEEQDFVRSAWNLIAHWNKGRRTTGENDRLEMYQPKNIPYTFISTLTAGLTDTKRLIDRDSSFVEDAAQWLLQQFRGRIPVPEVGRKWRIPGSVWGSSESGRFHEAFTRTCLHRRFFVTKGDMMGIGPETMETDDIIVILFGGKVPYVVRDRGDGTYSFIGECYVPGLMAGEAVEQWKASGRMAEFFTLV